MAARPVGAVTCRALEADGEKIVLVFNSSPIESEAEVELKFEVEFPETVYSDAGEFAAQGNRLRVWMQGREVIVLRVPACARSARSWSPMGALEKVDIIGSLRDVGLGADALLMVHASLSSFGQVTGGADTVIEALLDVVSAGTIVMPTYTDRSVSEDKDRARDLRDYDAREERSITGAISERFRLRPDVIRQPQNPWHPMAVWGRHQKKLIEAPAYTTYGFFMKHGGQTLLIGVGNEVHSFIHWMLDEAPTFGAPDTGVGAHSKLFSRLDPWIERSGAQRATVCGRSHLRLIDLLKAREAIHQALLERPDLLQTPSTRAEDAYRINITMPRPSRRPGF